MPVEGPAASVLQLKQYIVGKMSLKRSPDFDLVVTNPHTDEDYGDDGLIPRHASVVVRRIPGRMFNGSGHMVRAPAPVTVTQPKPDPVPLALPKPTPAQSKMAQVEDEFGEVLFNESETRTSQAPADEEAMIKAFCVDSATDWERQTQQVVMDRSRGFGRGGRGPGGLPGVGGLGGGRGPFFARKTLPDGYVCHRCHEPGHFIHHCPTNGNPAYDIKRVKLPTGIPRTMLVSNPSGSYALPNGEVATLRPNEEMFEKEMQGVTSIKAMAEIPAELRCPLCKEVLNDAVLTSKCCFNSFCDKCIRNEICSKGKCVCGVHVLAEDLLPNKTLRDAIQRLLTSAATTSSENVPSYQNAPDMESAVPVAKPPSPPVVKGPALPAKQEVSEAQAPAQNDTAEVSSAPTKEPPVADQAAEIPSAIDDENKEQDRKNKPKRRNPRQAPEQVPWMVPPFGYYPPMHVGNGFMHMGYGEPYNYPFVPPMMPGMVGAPFPPSDGSHMKEAARKRSHDYDDKGSEHDSSERRVRQKPSDTTECTTSNRDSRGRQSERVSESRDKGYKDGKHASRQSNKEPRESDHQGSQHRDGDRYRREYEDSRYSRHESNSSRRSRSSELESSRHEYKSSRQSRSYAAHRKEDRGDERKYPSGIPKEESNENNHHINHVKMQPV